MAASEGRSRVIRSIRLHLIFSDASVSFFALVSFFFVLSGARRRRFYWADLIEPSSVLGPVISSSFIGRRPRCSFPRFFCIRVRVVSRTS